MKNQDLLREKIVEILECVSIGGDIGLATTQILAFFPQTMGEKEIEKIILEWRGHNLTIPKSGVEKRCDCVECRKGGKIDELVSLLAEKLPAKTDQSQSFDYIRLEVEP